jgi:hypothetical protein
MAIALDLYASLECTRQVSMLFTYGTISVDFQDESENKNRSSTRRGSSKIVAQGT